MKPYLLVGELTEDQPKRFAVMSVDPTIRIEDGCSAIIQSLHTTREEAERAIVDAEA